MEMLSQGIRYVCYGISAEVIFTGLKSYWYDHDKKLQGFTQLWVVPMYGVYGIFVFEPLHASFVDSSMLIRLCVYGATFLATEYVFGMMYRFILGFCPWEYKSKWALQGCVNLPYFPLWGVLWLYIEYLM